MKIKCPTCSKVLNIPDSAAGKVVKCPCGKQLRAPGGSGAATAPKAAAPGTAAAKPAAKRPAAPAAGFSGFDADMLDELTEQDLKPVKSVARAGAPKSRPDPKKGAAVLQKHVAEADRKAEMLISTGFAPMPPFLIVVAIINALSSLLYLGIAMLILGVMAAVPMADEDFDAGEGFVFALIATGFAVTGILYLTSSLCCFLRGKFTWYYVIASYSFGIVVAADDVLVEVLDGGVGFWVVRRLGRVIVCIGIWAWLHGEDVRAFFGTDHESIGKVAGINAAFFAVASIFWLLPTFLAE